ncbi:MAG: pyridoxamine 5'-phosphate oxidase family protein [Bacillaceae bacterium]|nr:pyridoxamine 5'-phosphate oxidase family protein [Bacillaceae bacterium]
MQVFWHDRITSEEQLRTILGYPGKVVQRKVVNALDHHCRYFISQSPYVLLSTSDSSGNCDISPRGDTPGFVRVLDDRHLFIPERPGNRRLDSLTNL